MRILSTAATPLPSPSRTSTIINSGAVSLGRDNGIRLGRFNRADIVAHFLQHLGKQNADHGIVFDHKNAKGCRRRPVGRCRARSACRRLHGRVSPNGRGGPGVRRGRLQSRGGGTEA